MLDGGDFNTHALDAPQRGIEVCFVDLEGKVVQGDRLEADWLAEVLWKRRREGLVEEPDDLRVAAVAVGHLKKVIPSLEALDGREVSYSENRLT